MKSYKQMASELEELMNQLQASDTDIDSAMETYEKAAKLIKEMEAHLNRAENKITKIKATISGE